MSTSVLTPAPGSATKSSRAAAGDAAAANAPTDPRARAREAVKRVSSLATLPEVTSRIIATVENSKSTAADLHRIVTHDPALVTRILKVVNSAFYGLPGQVGSIERAIVLLGLNAIKNIAIAASLGQMFRGTKLCEGFTARDLWTHCIAVGVAARDMARQMKLAIVDEAFLAGMIHDTGILISLQLYPEKLAAVCTAARESQTDFCALEQREIGFDHMQLGMALAELWKFPKSCQLVAGYHHTPEAIDNENRTLVTLIKVADTICCHSRHGFNLTALHQTIDDAQVAPIRLQRAMIDQTAAGLDELMNVAANLLG